MNAIDILKKDHQEVLKIFKTISKTGPKALKKREELLNKVKNMVMLHAKIEEKLIYPLGIEKKSLENLTREAIEEHAAVKLLFARISKVPVDSENWLAKCTVIQENLKHHIEEEEKGMFPSLQKSLSLEELNELGIKILNFKKKHPI
ncbi:MAG: Hemerythrin cation binding domain protein [Francisellaceae bacterium]|nr:Hemerythrin cation binding domain protein [Francisellaceae bacterium]